uniref:Peroxisomal leader peptide-processing protease n=1 Tax=Graphocephala atropunctata TaxID=36148 RepID=A0A1B6KSY2_9HEMI
MCNLNTYTLRINAVVIAHGMLLAPLCFNSDCGDPIENFKMIMNDLEFLQSSSHSSSEAYIPIKFKILSNYLHSTTGESEIDQKRRSDCCNQSCVEDVIVSSLYKHKELSDITQDTSNGTSDNPNGGNDYGYDNQLINHISSLFIIMKVHKSSKTVDIENSLLSEYSRIKNVDIYPGLPLLIESSPCGHVSFANSYCQGIVSKIIGSDNDGILTDARLLSGCEGAPMYSFEDGVKGPLVGIVIQTTSWLYQEVVGFSLGLSAKHLLKGILGLQKFTDYIPFSNLKVEIPVRRVNMDYLSDAIVFVRCQHKTGSGVVIDAASGLILTCSHIIHHALDSVQVLCKGGKVPAKTVFASPPSSSYDLALISVGTGKCLKQLEFAATPPVPGEKVLVAGYPLSTESRVTANWTPTLSAGCVSKVSQRGGPVQTTCCTQSGVSGGALLRPPHQLLGIVSSSIQLEGVVLPSFSLAVSTEHFRTPIREYLKSGDPSCLRLLSVDNYAAKLEWALTDCKL